MYQRHKDNSNSNSISISINSSTSHTNSPTSSSPLTGSNGHHIHNSMASRQWKQFQREFYSFIFSTLGKSIILVAIIFGFYFLLGIIAMWSQYMTGNQKYVNYNIYIDTSHLITIYHHQHIKTKKERM